MTESDDIISKQEKIPKLKQKFSLGFKHLQIQIYSHVQTGLCFIFFLFVFSIKKYCNPLCFDTFPSFICPDS